MLAVPEFKIILALHLMQFVSSISSVSKSKYEDAFWFSDVGFLHDGDNQENGGYSPGVWNGICCPYQCQTL